MEIVLTKGMHFGLDLWREKPKFPLEEGGTVQVVDTTELYYSWNRNTAVMLYNLLSGHGKQKRLAHMINPYYNSL